MHQITSSEFKAAVELDPAWASKLKEPVEITGFCDMQESKITDLSPLLHFTGKSRDGNSANFSDCRSLKVAEGKFEGYVSFAFSSIKTIGDLSCGKNNIGWSANFSDCSSLKIAKGKFEGRVKFYSSGIGKIGDLYCEKNDAGVSLNVENCKYLTKIPITFIPEEINASPELIEKLEVDRFIQKRRAEIVEVEV